MATAMLVSLVFLQTFVSDVGAAAVGEFHVINNCPFESYLTRNVGDTANSTSLAANGGSYNRVYENPPGSTGPRYLLAKSPPPYSNYPFISFQYKLSNGQIYYSLNDYNGIPYEGYTVELTPSDSACESLTPAQFEPGPTAACEASASLTLTICSKG